MSPWQNVKPLIGPILGPWLLALGFKNPGRAMWRYRRDFVDVVEYTSALDAYGFIGEFGCTVREKGTWDPVPCECDFRASLHISFGIPEELFRFAPCADEQKRRLMALAPLVTASAKCWFAQFDCYETVLQAQSPTAKTLEKIRKRMDNAR